MSTYSNRLQPALLNLLQCVVRFFYPRSSCMVHISVDVFGGRKSLVKPMTWQKPAIILSCSVLPPEIVIHDDAYISGRSENNIKCIVHDDLGWRNQTTRYILPCYWLYEWFSQFHSCGTYSVLSRSPSIILPAVGSYLSLRSIISCKSHAQSIDVSFDNLPVVITLLRTSSLVIASSHLIFSILLHIYI